MITTRYNNSISDCLFRYAFARVLAQRFGYRLQVEELPSFPGTKQRVDGDVIFGPRVTWYGHWPIDQELQIVEPGDLYSPPGAKLVLSGSFQRFDLIAEYRDEIRHDWLALAARPKQRPSSEFVITCRAAKAPAQKKEYYDGPPEPRADGSVDIQTASQLTTDEIRILAKAVPHDNLHIVTDKADVELLRADLADLNPSFFTGSAKDCFLFISSFQKIAFSQISSHWWAAFLGDAKEIYFPPCDRGVWKQPEISESGTAPRHHGIDLRADDPRFIYDWPNN